MNEELIMSHILSGETLYFENINDLVNHNLIDYTRTSLIDGSSYTISLSIKHGLKILLPTDDLWRERYMTRTQTHIWVKWQNFSKSSRLTITKNIRNHLANKKVDRNLIRFSNLLKKYEEF